MADFFEHQVDEPNWQTQPFAPEQSPRPLFSPLSPEASPDVDIRPATSETTVRLDFDSLQPFERVERHFQKFGITFKNAIALQPSNPAFQPMPGKMVLMGSPKSGWLEAVFDRPVSWVSSSITGSRRTVMAAFDANNRPIAQAQTAGPNLAGSSSKLLPNLELSLLGEGIQRITLQTFDGQLTVSEFSFSSL
ncbi:hypothetical protein ACQ4M4_16945 [Leptolyngbya sp. AN02str]|uniref:hypothetical protein n=1 Tax=Leptolyngbya sp. AN02str TaxID=3423363 RepID=UPI003D3169CC